MENCVCIMRNLSYHVHKEIPGAEKFTDPSALQAPGSVGPQRKKKDDAGCFGGKKAKGERQGRHRGRLDWRDMGPVPKLDSSQRTKEDRNPVYYSKNGPCQFE